MRKKLLAFIFAVVFALSGCGGTVQEYSEASALAPWQTSSYVPSSVVTSSAPQQALVSAGADYVSTGIMNPLTGQDNLPTYMQKTRPVAVVMNNYIKALPQNGITAADMVIESEAEGGITRLLAFYSDWQNAPVVGSVREARLHYLTLCQMFDAIMVHHGASDETTAAIKSLSYSTLNAAFYSDGVLTYRDEELKKTRNTEHTVMTTGEMISNVISSRKLRTSLTDTVKSTFFSFASDGELVTCPQYKARSIYLNVGNSAEYRYDKTKGLYFRYLSTGAQTDLNNGEQVAVSNVVVLFTKQYTNKADSSLVTVELNAGEGYYFTLGTGCKIYWQRESADSGIIKLYDEKGYDLVLNQGKTWINIISDDKKGGVTWAEIGA